MPVWHILIIGLLACTCLALGMATIIIPLAEVGAQRWAWLGGLLAATLGVGALLALFLRYAGGSFDVKPRH